MSLLGLIMSIVFVVIVFCTLAYSLSWKGLMVAGCIPAANLMVFVGKYYEMWETAPFLPLWAMIVMYVVTWVCMIPVLTGDYFA